MRIVVRSNKRLNLHSAAFSRTERSVRDRENVRDFTKLQPMSRNNSIQLASFKKEKAKPPLPILVKRKRELSPRLRQMSTASFKSPLYQSLFRRGNFNPLPFRQTREITKWETKSPPSHPLLSKCLTNGLGTTDPILFAIELEPFSTRPSNSSFE